MKTVAILGRPNVGKSTLFNRLIGRKLALVDDQPGVTRDRREGEGSIADLTFRLFDTAGLDEAPRGSLAERMSAHSEAAIAEADVGLFVIDARAGITPVDSEFSLRLRRTGKPVILVANKAESSAADAGILEAYGLGLGDPVPISAEHGEGMDGLYERVRVHIQEDETEEDAAPDRPLRLAVVGQPNSGKSTLINALIGEERMLTGPEAGITRDAISIDWQWQDRAIKLWDTAGIRRKSRVTGKLEKLAVADALRAIRFADAVIVLVDATEDIERQDLALADLVAEEGRAIVIGLSKWDLIVDKQKRLKQVEDKLEDILPEIRGVPVVTLSAHQERGFERLMMAVSAAVEKWSARIPTGQLNRWLEAMIERNPPPAPSGRPIKIRYATQVKSRPPTITLFGNQLERLPESYIRYLMNGLRKDFELWGVPIRFHRRSGRNPYDKERE